MIFRDRDLRESYYEDKDAGRRRLLEMVGRYAALHSLKCVVVFDGGDTDEGRLGHTLQGSVDTIFVRDADRYIRQRVAKAVEGWTVTVVSSDEEHVARFSRQVGVGVLDVEEFMRRLRRMDRKERGRGEKPETETKTGVEYWIRRFRRGENDAESN